MKKIILLLLLAGSPRIVSAQIALTADETKNLIAIGEYYSNDVNLFSKSAVKDLEKFSMPRFTRVIATLQALAEKKKDLLDESILKKPSHDDLVLWYIIREIHYNRTDTTANKTTSDAVVKKYSAEKMDDRALLDNYYTHVQDGLSFLMNDQDLSKYDFDMKKLGLEQPAEQAIFYFNMTGAWSKRFMVLLQFKNYEKILWFAKHTPRFNGQPYYCFSQLTFEDFEWVGYQKTESYSQRNFSDVYNALLCHMLALLETDHQKDAKSLFDCSILSRPEYFDYSGDPETLRDIYKNWK